MRTLITAAGLIAITGMTAVPVTSREMARKDIRAMVFHGSALKETIRIDAKVDARVGAKIEPGMIIGLMLGMDDSQVRGIKTIDSPDFSGRPCFGVAVFTLGGKTSAQPLAELKAEDADRHFWIYPPSKNREGLKVGTVVTKFYDEQAKLLESVGVRYDSTSTACERTF